ncbi:MAG: xanthine dehydrogenase family protein subunit M [Acidobacteria bacterium]|nr:xanthine dehydrogenase family protein subunit M [Acidobacteriota bacterium]
MLSKLREFQYLRPRSLDEAEELIQQFGPDARILAGGTDLLVRMKERGLRARVVVDLKAIPGLAGIHAEPDGSLRIGALTTLGDIERSSHIRAHFPLLWQGASCVGSVQVRNRATVGGNLCNASPAADTAPPLLALGGEAILRGERGERRLLLEKFFTGPGRTAMGQEILVGISIPPNGAGSSLYLKHSPRRAMDIAIVSVAVRLDVDSQTGVCGKASIVLGAVAPVPLRARAAEQTLEGQRLTAQRLEDAARAAQEAAQPIGDLRGTAAYRREMVWVLTRRALVEASGAGEGSTFFQG